MPASPYFRSDLARIHHEGFGFHADAVAPGILTILEPVLERGGLVLELGCGSGLLTKSLVEAGHRVLATDASPAMVDLARDFVPTVPVEVLRLPDDPLPTADAIVSVGHALSYLDSEEDIDRSLAAMAGALEVSGILAFDICDLEWGAARREQPPGVWFGDDWVLATRRSVIDDRIFRREMTMFVRDGELWRRDDETHDNVLIDTSRLPELLARFGVDAEVRHAFFSHLPIHGRSRANRTDYLNVLDAKNSFSKERRNLRVCQDPFGGFEVAGCATWRCSFSSHASSTGFCSKAMDNATCLGIRCQRTCSRVSTVSRCQR